MPDTIFVSDLRSPANDTTMHPGNISGAAGRIHEAMDELQIAWQTASNHWKDSSSENVLENHLKPMEHEVRLAIPAISHFLQVVSQAQRELQE